MHEQVDLNLASPCGSYCGECDSYKKNCSGCGHVKRKPLWDECRFYSSLREKKVEHCGLCSDFPCEYFLSTYDPSEGEWRVFYRARQLAYKKKIRTNAWTEEKAEGEAQTRSIRND